MREQRRRTWGWAIVALGLGLLLRLWFVAHAERIAGDTLLYADIAQNWMHHGVYGMSTANPAAPRPTLIRLPGYPLFLALCFGIFGPESYRAVMVVQALVDLGTCLLVACIALRCFGRRAAMVALWLAALCPFTANYVSAPLTETLTLFTIVLAFYALLEWQRNGCGLNRWLTPLTLALAYSILLRPEQGLLAAAIVPAMLWIGRPKNLLSDRRRLAAIAIVCIGTVLPLAPWAARNWRTFHVVQPLAPRYATDPGELVPLSFQRWFRSWGLDFIDTETAYWNYDGASINIADLPNRAFDTQAQYDETAALLNDYNVKDSASPAFEARFERIARDRIAFSPLRYYVALPIARLVDMLLRPRTEMLATPLDWWNVSAHPGGSLFAMLWAAISLGFLIAGATGLRLSLRADTGCSVLLWSMLAFVVLRCAMLLTLDNSEPRYTLEFFPLLCVWAAGWFTTKSATDR